MSGGSLALRLAIVSTRPATLEVDLTDLVEWFAKVRTGYPPRSL